MRNIDPENECSVRVHPMVPDLHRVDADGVPFFAGDVQFGARPLEHGKKGHGDFQSALLIDHCQVAHAFLFTLKDMDQSGSLLGTTRSWTGPSALQISCPQSGFDILNSFW